MTNKKLKKLGGMKNDKRHEVLYRQVGMVHEAER